MNLKKHPHINVCLFFVTLIVNVLLTNAQYVDNPWHIVAIVNKQEVAFYNTQVVSSIKITPQHVIIELNNGKSFLHSLTTTTFRFDPHEIDAETSNEALTTPKLNVNY